MQNITARICRCCTYHRNGFLRSSRYSNLGLCQRCWMHRQSTAAFWRENTVWPLMHFSQRRWRCSRPLASYRTHPWPTSAKKRSHFYSAVLGIFQFFLRKPTFRTQHVRRMLENATWELSFSRRRQKLENAGVFVDRTTPPPRGLASFCTFLLISQKWHDFWLSYAGESSILPQCPSFHFHIMQLIRDGQSCCSVQKQ